MIFRAISQEDCLIFHKYYPGNDCLQLIKNEVWKMFVLVTDCTYASHFRQHERVLKQTIRYNVASILRDDTERQVPTSPITNR